MPTAPIERIFGDNSFFAGNRSSPAEPWRGFPIGSFKGMMWDSRTAVLGKSRRLYNGKAKKGIPNPGLLALPPTRSKTSNPNKPIPSPLITKDSD